METTCVGTDGDGDGLKRERFGQISSSWGAMELEINVRLTAMQQ